jgi:mannose/fructose/N-acetylgalactosamine-specific phosphotransferase system component IIC
MIVGDPGAGLICGAWFQLVWILPLPVGGAILPDGSIASIAAVVAWSVFGMSAGSAVALPFALGVGLLLSAHSCSAERVARNLMAQVEEWVPSGRRVPGWTLALGIAGPFARGAVSVLLALAMAQPVSGGTRVAQEALGPAAAGRIAAEAVPALMLGAAVVAGALIVARMRQEVGRHLLGWVLAAALFGAAVRLGWNWLQP